MKKTIMLFVFLILIPSVFSLTCQYDEEPYIDNNVFIRDKIFMLCTTNSTDTSYCYVYLNESNVVVQSNPEPIYVDEVGVDNEYFETKGGKVNVYYTSRNIYVHHNYSVTVDCSYLNGTTETFTTSVIPVYKTLDSVAYRTEWGKQNMVYIVFIIIILIACYVVYRLFIKREG